MLLQVNGSPFALPLGDRFHFAFHQHFTVLQWPESKEEKKKKTYQRLFIKYSTMTKFCKTSKWENRGDTQLDILPRKSSLGDEPHYLSTHGSENQANHTTNRWPITASQNCLSTNQVFIPFSEKRKKEKSTLSCCASAYTLIVQQQTQL